VFARIRERGLAATIPALAYFEWSVDDAELDDVDDEVAEDPEAWAQANPGLGIRISREHIAREQRSMDPRTFAVERLGVGDWPVSTATRPSRRSTLMSGPHSSTSNRRSRARCASRSTSARTGRRRRSRSRGCARMVFRMSR
jgi:hypothetical protein